MGAINGVPSREKLAYLVTVAPGIPLSPTAFLHRYLHMNEKLRAKCVETGLIEYSSKGQLVWKKLK